MNAIVSDRRVIAKEISESFTNDLRITLVEMVLQSDADKGYIAQRWLLSFKKYLAYQVRNESFALVESIESDNHPVKPNRNDFLFVEEQSGFLVYVRQTTWADESFPGPLTHYLIVTANHVIDIAAFADPEIVNSGSDPL